MPTFFILPNSGYGWKTQTSRGEVNVFPGGAMRLKVCMLPGLPLLAGTQLFSFIGAASDGCANGGHRLESHSFM